MRTAYTYTHSTRRLLGKLLSILSTVHLLSLDGLQIDFFVMSLKKPEGLGDKYDFYGIRRIDPQMSIQYYL